MCATQELCLYLQDRHGDTVNVLRLTFSVVLIPDTNTIPFFFSSDVVLFFFFLCYFVRGNKIEAMVKIMGVYESMKGLREFDRVYGSK